VSFLPLSLLLRCSAALMLPLSTQRATTISLTIRQGRYSRGPLLLRHILWSTQTLTTEAMDHLQSQPSRFVNAPSFTGVYSDPLHRDLTSCTPLDESMTKRSSFFPVLSPSSFSQAPGTKQVIFSDGSTSHFPNPFIGVRVDSANG